MASNDKIENKTYATHSSICQVQTAKGKSHDYTTEINHQTRSIISNKCSQLNNASVTEE